MMGAATCNDQLAVLCSKVRSLVAAGEYSQCEALICEAMGQFPHAAQPHNLIGIILEKQGQHAAAMRHFRAAWALDPTFFPAKHNLDTFGTFYNGGVIAYEESDCPEPAAPKIEIVYDKNGIGRPQRRY